MEHAEMYSKITITLLVLLAVSASFKVIAAPPNVEKLLNVDEKKTVRVLSRKILKSRVARKKQIQQQLKLDRAELEEYQRELTRFGQSQNTIDKTSTTNKAWVEVLVPDKNRQSKIRNQQANDKASSNKYNKISNRFAALANVVDEKIPASMKIAQPVHVKGNEKREAKKNKKILALLRRVESDFRNVNVADPKQIDRLNKTRKRFEIQSKAQKEGVNNKFSLPQPTNKLKLIYSVEEFEAMK